MLFSHFETLCITDRHRQDLPRSEKYRLGSNQSIYWSNIISLAILVMRDPRTANKVSKFPFSWAGPGSNKVLVLVRQLLVCGSLVLVTFQDQS